MSSANPEVDAYFRASTQWPAQIERLRAIVLACGLTEELKWRQPCYTHQGKNVAVIGEFKNYCVLSFFKGSLLSDPHGLLVAPGENTQTGRMFRFTSVQQIDESEPILTAYIREAIDIEQAGLEVNLKTTAEFAVPEELQSKLDESPAFKTAFEALTPGRQRGYLLHFAQPRQSKTRSSRVQKHVQRILDGKGLRDR